VRDSLYSLQQEKQKQTENVNPATRFKKRYHPKLNYRRFIYPDALPQTLILQTI
jgi:hypothetical protein